MTTINGNINITGTINNSLSTTVATLTTAASKNKCFQYTLYDSGITTNYRIGTLHLPQNGNQAVIKLNLCCGYNITPNNSYSNSYRIQNYELSIHIYSGNGGLNGQQVVGSARAFDPGSTNGGPYAIGIFYSGYVVATTPHATPLYVYLGFVASDPLNQVDVYICSYAWHGNPLVSVHQSAGYFDQSTAGKFVNIPNPGVT